MRLKDEILPKRTETKKQDYKEAEEEEMRREMASIGERWINNNISRTTKSGGTIITSTTDKQEDGQLYRKRCPYLVNQAGARSTGGAR